MLTTCLTIAVWSLFPLFRPRVKKNQKTAARNNHGSTIIVRVEWMVHKWLALTNSRALRVSDRRQLFANQVALSHHLPSSICVLNFRAHLSAMLWTDPSSASSSPCSSTSSLARTSWAVFAAFLNFDNRPAKTPRISQTRINYSSNSTRMIKMKIRTKFKSSKRPRNYVQMMEMKLDLKMILSKKQCLRSNHS